MSRLMRTGGIALAARTLCGATNGTARGDTGAMCMLLEAGGAVEDVHLDLTVRSGSLETVRFFVERGCDVQKVRVTSGEGVAAYLKSQGWR